MYKNFSDWYKKTLINSENKIKKIWLKNLKIEDVFLESLNNINWTTKEVFDLYWIDYKLILEIINKWIFNEKIEKRKWVYSWMDSKLKNIILSSVKIAASFSKENASIEDFILAIMENNNWLNSVLDYIWIIPSDLKTNLIDLNKVWTTDWNLWKNLNFSNSEIEKLLWDLTNNLFPENWMEWETNTPFDRNKNIEKKEESETPALDFFSTDLTLEATNWKLDKVIWRETEIERLIAILNRKTKNNPALIWEPWVGKTAVVEWLASRIASWNVPFSMKDKKILALDMTSIIAGTKFRWEFELRIKQIIEEASKAENQVILFIDEIHTIIWAWAWEWGLDASNILKPAMWRWKIRVIWATTRSEYKKYIEKDSALERRFQKIEIEEPEKSTAIEIISWLKEGFENFHNLNITQEAIEQSVELSDRYITDRNLPDKAIDLIDEACSLKSMAYNIDEAEIKKIKDKIAKITKEIEQAVIASNYKQASKLKDKQAKLEKQITDIKKEFSIPKKDRFTIEKKDIQKVLNITTWIPTDNLNTSEIERLKKLPKNLKQNIIWQDEAVEALVKSIMRNKVWIADQNRPTWSFLFLWPTWVWKTELVKTLANEFYSDKNALIKIDMSEYSDKTSVNKLIGSNAWYIGYEEGWLLTEKVRKKPYSIVLFDEIEKWNFDVYNLLLQILEEWVLTDNKWRKVNFKNTIIIMTSNIGQDEFNEKAAKIWFDVDENEEEKIMKDFTKAKENIISNLWEYFSPEFINRIDKTIVFSPLDKTNIKKIVKLQIEKLKKRLNEKKLELTYDLKVLNYITKKVYNPDFWAREIRRFLIDNIEDTIAEKIINNPKKEKFEISIIKDELIIK